MVNATFTEPVTPFRVTRLRTGVLTLLLVLVLGGVAAGLVWVLRQGRAATQATAPDTAPWPAWLKQQAAYPVPEAPPAAAPAPVRNETAEQLALLRRELAEQRQALEALKNRPGVPPPTKPAAPAGPKPKHPPMLYIAHEVKAPVAPERPQYTLAPGATKIPCIIETAINSDVEGYLTAKVHTNVYDTATGRHLLIPQHSTILGHTQSSQLLYGNERLPTISLTLALPDGQSVDLGQAPITDQQGVAGLTGDVNHHFWRNLGAVFIAGALRGGAQAIQTGTAGAGAAGQIASGMTSTTSQFGQQKAGRYIDTRPTITVEAGQLCNVLLIKPLTLPALGE